MARKVLEIASKNFLVNLLTLNPFVQIEDLGNDPNCKIKLPNVGKKRSLLTSVAKFIKLKGNSTTMIMIRTCFGLANSSQPIGFTMGNCAKR